MAPRPPKRARTRTDKLRNTLTILREFGVTKYADGLITLELQPEGVDVSKLTKAFKESEGANRDPILHAPAAGWLSERRRLPDELGEDPS